MRKFILAASIALVVLSSCETEQLSESSLETDAQVKVDMSDFEAHFENMDLQASIIPGRPTCHTMHYLAESLKEDPTLFQKLYNTEKSVRTHIAKRAAHTANGTKLVADNFGTVTIPVVVHVVYKTNAQNISNAQIQSQIDVLNEDFNATNGDLSGVPNQFQNRIGDSNIEFVLDRVIRKKTSRNNFPFGNRVKKNNKGGSNPVDSSNYLNMWVCNLKGDLLGYANFPGDNKAKFHGVVVDYQYFGTTGTATAPFNLGRTAVHEVGHWLNLYHIDGDGGCSVDDLVSDTPATNLLSSGCPNFPRKKCGSNDMTLNYMDYSDDACMYMFTAGQVDRMRASFASGGGRTGFVN